MKIAIDLTSLADNFTGIERFASSITYEMLMNHPEHEYILLFKREVFGTFVDLDKKENVTFRVLKECNKLMFLQISLLKEMLRIKADYYLFLAFPTPLLLLKKNMITTIHDIGCWDEPDAMTLMSRTYFRMSYRKDALFDKHIFTVSNFSKERICSKLKIPSKKVSVVYNGISDVFRNYTVKADCEEEILKKYKLPQQYLLCLSTLEPRKNMRLLIEAYEELCLQGKIDSELVLAGRKGWKMDHLLDSIEPSVVEHIHFTGFVEDEDLPVVYKYARCFVFPSKYEGFGIPPLEALSMGTSVISSDAASMPEVLGKYAVYFRNNDKEDLKTKIIEFLKTENKIDERESKQIIEKYNWKSEADRLVEQLGKLG